MHRFVFVLVITFIVTLTTPAVRAGECVVLLHWLACSANSLLFMDWCLKRAGYDVVNLDHPSKEAMIEDPADRVIPKALYRCLKAEMIHFVTHSMGGIFLRYYMKRANP
jgi:triacylglycerol lipase